MAKNRGMTLSLLMVCLGMGLGCGAPETEDGVAGVVHQLDNGSVSHKAQVASADSAAGRSVSRELCPAEPLPYDPLMGTGGGDSADCVPAPPPSPPSPPPPPPPPPPPASEAVLGKKPEIAGLSYLSAAGLDTRDLFNEKWVGLCELHLFAKKRFIGSPRIDENTCISGPPPGYKVLLTRIAVQSEGNCSRSTNVVRGGTDYAWLSEIDRIYTKAIELALKAGDREASIKLGEMRDYHKSILQVSSKTDIFSMWGKATSGTGFGTNGWCDLVLEGLLIKD